MLFHIFSDTDIRFVNKEFEQRRYSIAEVLSTSQRVEIFYKREFTAVAMNENAKTFVIYVVTLSTSVVQVYPSCQVQFELLLANKALTKVPSKYSDYADIFLFNRVMELSEKIDINKYAIKLLKGKQLPYRPIYSPRPVELEILKIYIETHLKTIFIQLFKSLVGAPIFFD